MNLKGRRVMVVGTGVSGIGAVKLLNQAGAQAVLYDANGSLDRTKIEEKLGENQAEIILGELTMEEADRIQLLVISPGVPVDSDLVMLFHRRGVPVWGEIELAWQFEKGHVIAITGTNGKTTTTALVGQIIGAWNASTFVVGNIGKSYTGEVTKTSPESYTVAEISSFQLETVQEFHPAVSAILNITPDHLNRHHTMKCYEQTKERICENQTEEDSCILNYDDARLRQYGKSCPARVIWFGRQQKPPVGYFLDGDMICYTDGREEEKILNVQDMNLIGSHNYENVMAAIGICRAAGVPDEIILREVRTFKAVEHRIEYVATKNGVLYYNDSKGTNPEAAVKAIEAMTRPTILIGGGFDKGSEFDLYVKAFPGHVKLLVLLGQTSDKIAQTAKNYGFTNIIKAQTLEEVVKICAENAQEGDAVLLSPACASWGMFDNYEQRGRMFKDYVNAL